MCKENCAYSHKNVSILKVSLKTDLYCTASMDHPVIIREAKKSLYMWEEKHKI